MARYFIEVAYKGTNYSGFQIQKNSNSVQAEIEKALAIFFKAEFQLTGSSRTDAGVHALQNYFHFDAEDLPENELPGNIIYSLNSILPFDVVIKRIYAVLPDSHCRFDAKSRTYKYYLFKNKNPFIADRAYYYPYKLDLGRLNEAAAIILQQQDFTSFSKKKTQSKTFTCNMMKSSWVDDQGQMVYTAKGNRFLRGMVRGMVGTMLKVGREKISVDEFRLIFQNKNAAGADFSVPAHGLFLTAVEF